MCTYVHLAELVGLAQSVALSGPFSVSRSRPSKEAPHYTQTAAYLAQPKACLTQIKACLTQDQGLLKVDGVCGWCYFWAEASESLMNHLGILAMAGTFWYAGSC